MSNNKTRAQSVAEYNKASKHPAWTSASRSAPWPTVELGPGKSRREADRVEMRAGAIPSGQK
ncbi:hypothetical protein ABL840_18865 [Variovorax sp. NFACC27]|uniref:hypothetical protein n=1 Tax=unclassified Variovorax TaxID=663243 RepID=UPI00115F87AA